MPAAADADPYGSGRDRTGRRQAAFAPPSPDAPDAGAGAAVGAGVDADDVDALSDALAPDAGALDDDVPASVPDLPASAPDFLPLSRKSVTYHPEPLSWKLGAASCLRNAALPQDGQSVRGGSLRFCSTSFSNPHWSHR